MWLQEKELQSSYKSATVNAENLSIIIDILPNHKICKFRACFDPFIYIIGMF